MMKWVFDLATVLIAGWIIWVSYRKGLVRSIVELAGYIASLIVAYFFSAPLGTWIYEKMLKSAISGLVSRYASDVAGGLSQSLSDLLGQLKLNSNLFGAVLNHSGQASGAVIGTIADPLGLSIGKSLAFIIIFFLCLCAVRILARLTDIIGGIPVIGTLNRLGGAAIGIVKAAIVLFVLSTLVAAILPAVSMSKNPVFTRETISQTSVFKYIYQFNPFENILLKK